MRKAPVTLEVRVADFLLRAKGGMSICAFASQLGMDKSILSRILRGKHSMRLCTLQCIAEALGVTPDRILKMRKGEGAAFDEHRKKPGRLKVVGEAHTKAQELLKKGRSVREISMQLGICRQTLHTAIRSGRLRRPE